jgi:hypothetical protein
LFRPFVDIVVVVVVVVVVVFVVGFVVVDGNTLIKYPLAITAGQVETEEFCRIHVPVYRYVMYAMYERLDLTMFHFRP